MVAAAIHAADEGDTTTLKGTLEAAEANLAEVGMAPNEAGPAELVADKGYHSRTVLKDLDGGAWKTPIAEPQRTAILRWRGDTKARDTLHAHPKRKAGMRRRAEIVERSFAHNLEQGGMRRTWLRGREKSTNAT